MNIDFKNKKLSKIFNSEGKLQKNYGKRMAQVIKRRMMILNAAPNLEDVCHLPPERRHELVGRRKGTFAVDLQHPKRLVFRPAHHPIPQRKEKGIDLKKVTAITILGVEDYH
ncbi:killer suppression protein [candidate division TA06 bacterium]|uniref:Killer suppression protein n=1 Tax=candidate division TA06 bacterium TaxID=2250710 RepID=A0A523UQF2_UNCT6|nr:MAG: killer suppression protein [candidate division TA06 bacterium]